MTMLSLGKNPSQKLEISPERLTRYEELKCKQSEAKNFALSCSDDALRKIREAFELNDEDEGDLLRISVTGGGCAGLQYALNFTSEVFDDDFATLNQNAILVMDTFSAYYLQGTTLEYIDALEGSGFKFINPNATRTCGCGSSFAA